jgi:hypothetical protein
MNIPTPRHMALLILLLGRLALTPAAAQDAQPESRPDAADGAREDLYKQALQSIAEGRRNDASRELSRLVEKEPEHAGAWLDLAMTQCALGHADEAERMFAVIETRFAPPRALLELIAEAREQGCARWQPSRSATLSLGRGVDRNVNQGASTSTYLFDGPDGRYEQTLSDDFIPRRDQYTVLGGDAMRELTPNGSIGFAQFQLRRNDRFHAYDSGSLVAGVESPWRVQRWSLRTSAALAVVTLGGRLYQRQAQLQARIAPPLPLPNSTQFNLLAGVTRSEFVTLTNFDSNSYEVRSQLMHRNDTSYASASLAVQRDHALAQRPGGDRDGWYGGLLYRRRLGQHTSGELGASYQRWDNRLPYAPGLINQVRDQATAAVRASLLYALGKNQSLQLEGRVVRNQENISIFQYNNRTLQLSWQWQTF